MSDLTSERIVLETRFLTKAEAKKTKASWLERRAQTAEIPERPPGAGYPDPAIFALTDSLNSIPGLVTTQSCAGHVTKHENSCYRSPANLWIRLSRSMHRAFMSDPYALARLIDRVELLFMPGIGDILNIDFAGSHEPNQFLAASKRLIDYFSTLREQAGPERWEEHHD